MNETMWRDWEHTTEHKTTEYDVALEKYVEHFKVSDINTEELLGNFTREELIEVMYKCVEADVSMSTFVRWLEEADEREAGERK